jgi:hypothetical protein
VNSRWSYFYDRVKDRRYGSLFFFTLVAGLAAAILVRGLSDSDVLKTAVDVWPMILGVLMIWLTLAVHRVVTRRNEQTKNSSRLSSDEVTKARSKLLKNRNRGTL